MDADEDRTEPLGNAPEGFGSSRVYLVSPLTYNEVERELGVLVALGYAERQMIVVEKKGWLRGAVVTILNSRVAQVFEDWVYMKELELFVRPKESKTT